MYGTLEQIIDTLEVVKLSLVGSLGTKCACNNIFRVKTRMSSLKCLVITFPGFDML